jgi:thiol-disulfide isomerase/thioredoxin
MRGGSRRKFISGANAVDMTRFFIKCLFLVHLLAVSALGGEDFARDEKDSAYGVVLRKQSAGNRVMIQPIEGLFPVDAEIKFIDKKGDVICGGKVQKAYYNLIYAVAEGCEKFDDLKSGVGVTFNRDGKIMQEKYDSKDKIDEAAREIEWKKSSGLPMEISEDQFENIVKKSKVPVFFEIYATWCPRCDEFKPILGEIATDLEGKVRVAVTDEQKCPELKKELKVNSYPALFVFVDGKIVEEWRGAYPKKKDTVARINVGLNKATKK